MAGDGIIQRIQVHCHTVDDLLGVLRNRLDLVFLILAQGNTLLDDPHWVNIAEFSLEQNVHCPAARFVASTVALEISFFSHFWRRQMN